MCCSPTKITELSESVLVEDILVEFQKRVVLGRNYKRGNGGQGCSKGHMISFIKCSLLLNKGYWG